MKKIESTTNVNQNIVRQKQLLEPFLSNYNFDEPREQRKFEELNQTIMFLILFDHSWNIKTIREEPDFIISNGEKSVALEHTAIRDHKFVSQEGSIIDTFHRAEKILRDESFNYNFLVNIHLNRNFKYKKSDSSIVVHHICHAVKTFILYGTLVDSQLITWMSAMDHNRISLSPNFGAWWQAPITPELIEEHVSKKENLLQKYRANTQLEQWLLLVIGHYDQGSFAKLDALSLNLKTNFNRVFLMEISALTIFEIEILS